MVPAEVFCFLLNRQGPKVVCANCKYQLASNSSEQTVVESQQARTQASDRTPVVLSASLVVDFKFYVNITSCRSCLSIAQDCTRNQTGEMAQGIKCLALKPDDLIWDPRTHIKARHNSVSICNPMVLIQGDRR